MNFSKRDFSLNFAKNSFIIATFGTGRRVKVRFAKNGLLNDGIKIIFCHSTAFSHSSRWMSGQCILKSKRERERVSGAGAVAAPAVVHTSGPRPEEFMRNAIAIITPLIAPWRRLKFRRSTILSRSGVVGGGGDREGSGRKVAYSKDILLLFPMKDCSLRFCKVRIWWWRSLFMPKAKYVLWMCLQIIPVVFSAFWWLQFRYKELERKNQDEQCSLNTLTVFVWSTRPFTNAWHPPGRLCISSGGGVSFESNKSFYQLHWICLHFTARWEEKRKGGGRRIFCVRFFQVFFLWKLLEIHEKITQKKYR